MPTSRKRTDRLMSALDLIQSGACWKASTGNWIVKSQSKAGSSYVTGIKHGAVFCSCRDFELHGRPCKHSLAAISPVTVQFALQCRWAQDSEELAVVLDLYKERLATELEPFKAIARIEYRLAVERLSAITAVAA